MNVGTFSYEITTTDGDDQTVTTYDEDKAYNQFPVGTATGETIVSGTTINVGA
jgi:hypothetical protein